MAKYRKKPIVIEATQWFQNGDHPDDSSRPLAQRVYPWPKEGQVVRRYRNPFVEPNNPCEYCGIRMHDHGWIDMVQGGHVVCPGDWIITDDRVVDDQHGHFYPCKPDIFAETYEPAYYPDVNLDADVGC